MTAFVGGLFLKHLTILGKNNYDKSERREVTEISMIE